MKSKKTDFSLTESLFPSGPSQDSVTFCITCPVCRATSPSFCVDPKVDSISGIVRTWVLVHECPKS
jgi:hypothetical protein